jgi:uncharacterized membrane protein
MDPVALMIGLGFTVVGTLIILLCIPLTRDRVPRNWFYGMRTPTSLRSDAAWYAINRFGGRRFIAWGVPVVLLGVAGMFLPLVAHPGLTFGLVGAELLCIVVPWFQTARYSRRFKNRA